MFTEMNTPTRIFEYLARGKPVIAPLAQGICDYFGPEDLVFFKLGDQDDLAQKMEFVFSNYSNLKEIVARGQKVYSMHQWQHERERMLQEMAGLLSVKRAPERDSSGEYMRPSRLRCPFIA